MKIVYIAVITLFSLCFLGIETPQNPDVNASKKNIPMKANDSVLRHVVLFKFKEGTPSSTINKVEEAFSALPSKIPQIKTYEWGLNNSPEGLDKGFTHCFFLTFESEADRAIYLPHPDHKAFGAVLTPHLEDVLVLDYWTNQKN